MWRRLLIAISSAAVVIGVRATPARAEGCFWKGCAYGAVCPAPENYDAVCQPRLGPECSFYGAICSWSDEDNCPWLNCNGYMT